MAMQVLFEEGLRSAVVNMKPPLPIKKRNGVTLNLIYCRLAASLIDRACALIDRQGTHLVAELLDDVTDRQKEAWLREAVPVLLVLQCRRIVILHVHSEKISDQHVLHPSVGAQAVLRILIHRL